MLKHAILGFLKYKPSTGYEIKQTMDKSTGHFWHAKQSQIYTTPLTMNHRRADPTAGFMQLRNPEARNCKNGFHNQ